MGWWVVGKNKITAQLNSSMVDEVDQLLLIGIINSDKSRILISGKFELQYL